jgi:exosortase
MSTNARRALTVPAASELPGLLTLLGVGLATALVVAPAFAHAVEVWTLDAEFNYGFFIVPVALLLTWWRRDALRRAVGPGATAGLLVVVGALALYLFTSRIGIRALAGLAVIPLLWGIVAYLWGWGAARVLAFPIGFLVFGLGLYRGLLYTVGFAMQEITAVGASTLARTLGTAVERDGLTLTSDRFQFVVAEPCSGMSSLLSLLALSAVWTYVANGTLPARLAVLLSVVPIVVVANTTRVTLVLLVASWLGQDAAEGFFHGASSLLLFGIALGGLLLVSRSMGCGTLSTEASS